MENTNQNFPEEKDVSKKEEKKNGKADKKEEKKQAKAEKKAKRKKLSKEDKKGVLLVIALVIVAIVLFNVCINAGKKDEGSATATNATTESTTQAAVVDIVTTTQPVTQTPTAETTAVTTQTLETTANSSTQATTEKQETTVTTETTKATEPSQPAALTDAEILDIVTKGVNSLKSDTASFTGHKTQIIDIQLIDCSLPSVTGLVNKVIEFFIGTEEFDFDFTNGKTVNPETGEEDTSMHIFPPQDRNFALTIEGVAKTSVTETADGTVYAVTVVPESSTLEDPRPPHHDSAGDTLDLSGIELPMGEVTTADFEYPGATFKITLDGDGKVVGYEERLEIKGTGVAEGLGLSASGEMEGHMSEVWQIEWK